MMSLLKSSWDLIEKMIDEMLSEHMKTWYTYDYFVVNDTTLIVKVIDKDNMVRFTIRAQLKDGKLEVVEVS